MDNELDPEIAKLLADAASGADSSSQASYAPPVTERMEQPDPISDDQTADSAGNQPLTVDLSRKQFKPIEKFFSDHKNAVFL